MPLATIVNDKIVLETRFVDRYLIEKVPGIRHDKTLNVWQAPLSWGTCVVLRTLFREDLELSQELQDWAWSQRQLWIDSSLALRSAYQVPETWTERESDKDLRPFQKIGIRFLTNAQRCLLAEPMGSGKTVQVVRAMMREVELYGEHANVFPALIVCPTGVMLGWRDEFTHWYPGVDVGIIHGGIVNRRKVMDEQHDVYVINYEGLRAHSRLAGYGSIRLRRCVECDKNLPPDEKHPRHLCERCPKELNQMSFNTVVLDEAHRIKNPGSKQSRAAFAVAKEVPQYRWALTGTPIDKDPSDLWPIMHAISGEDFPGRDKYIELFCQKGFNFWGGAEILGLRPEHRDAFFQIVDPRMRRLPKEVILPQLPPVIRSTRIVTMGTKQARAYEQMRKHMVANLDGELLMAPNPLTKMGRLMQLAAACANVEYEDVTDREGQTKRIKRVELIDPSCKLDALEEIVDESAGGSIVVASASRKLAVLAMQRMERRDITVGMIAGGMDIYARKTVEREFQTGKIQVVICVIDAAGEGLTLTAANTLVYINKHWSNLKNVQMDNRVHRIGSEVHEHVNIIDVVTDNTVEFHQLQILAGKQERLEEIVRDRQTLLRLLGEEGMT